MTDHRAALEKYNRETHSDALREMQMHSEFALVEAQAMRDLQFEPIRVANYDWLTIPIAFALGVVLTVVAVGA